MFMIWLMLGFGFGAPFLRCTYFGCYFEQAMDVSDLSASSMEYESGNTDEEEFNISSANDNAPPEDEQTSGDDDVDESVSETELLVLFSTCM